MAPRAFCPLSESKSASRPGRQQPPLPAGKFLRYGRISFSHAIQRIARWGYLTPRLRITVFYLNFSLPFQSLFVPFHIIRNFMCEFLFQFRQVFVVDESLYCVAIKLLDLQRFRSKVIGVVHIAQRCFSVDVGAPEIVLVAKQVSDLAIVFQCQQKYCLCHLQTL